MANISNKEEGPILSKNESKSESKSNNHVSVLSHSLQKSEAWISEMKTELSWLSNDNRYHVLRAVFHALRDQLSVNEAAHFSAQLPLVLRGTFYEGWNPPQKQPKALSKQEFLMAMRDHLQHADLLKFDLEKGAAVALGVIMSHVSYGEMNDIVKSSSESLKSFFNIVESFNLGYTYQ